MILYGKPVAQKIYEKIKKEISDLNLQPRLAVVLVGENPASLSYVRLKEKIAQSLGVEFKLYHLDQSVAQIEIENLIIKLNGDDLVSGIVLQLPLPENIETEKIINLMSPKKDVDGFLGEYQAPTAQAILDIFDFYKIELQNKEIVVVGHGRLVGQPLKKMLENRHIDVDVCDSKTKDLTEKTLQADILISATGVPNLIKPSMLKSDTIIIDAGTAEANGKMVGDVDESVYEKIETYTPTPGGVGPVTVAELFLNLITAAKK